MFSKLPRDPFEINQYNPGVGYYDNQQNSLGSQNHIKKHPQQFSKSSRFSHNSFSASSLPPHLGPGSYNPNNPNHQQTQKKQPNHQNSNSQNQNEKPIFKVNAIPSIPSSNITAGYQEIGEGLLILIKNNKQNDNDKLGPATYKPNYDFVKKKIEGFQIRPEAEKKKQVVEKDNPYVELVPQREFGSDQNNTMMKSKKQKSKPSTANFKDRREKSLSTYKETVNQVKQQFDSLQIQQQSQLFPTKSQMIQNISQSQNLHTNNDFNLELLVMREKQLMKTQNGPSVGEYYNEKNFSSFAKFTKQKPKEFQCFDSSSARFGDIKAINDIGPGFYEVRDRKNNQTYSMGQSKKITEHLGIHQNKINLDPGQYQQDIINEPKINPNRVDYASIFGSGTQRFKDNKYQTPSVGQYNLGQQRTRRSQSQQKISQLKQGHFGPLQHPVLINKPPKISTFTSKKSQKLDDNSQDDSNSYIFQNLSQRNVDNSSNYQQQRTSFIQSLKKTQKQPSSQFASQIKRFKHDQEHELGPGQYDFKQNSQTKNSHNQVKDLGMGGKSSRIQRSESMPKKVGPGSYDYDISKTKENKNVALQFK